MTTIRQAVLTGIAAMTLLAGAAGAAEPTTATKAGAGAPAVVPVRPEIYAPVTLAADLSTLNAKERQLLGLFIEAGEIMDDLYWRQTYGQRDALLKGISDPRTRDFVALNYGPWDRLADNSPFVAGIGAKPEGAEFYPHDMTREEFEKANLPQSRSEYTLLRRDAKGALKVVPYHVEYRDALEKAALKLEQAAALAEDPGLKKYLSLRAQALRTDDFRASDRAWLDMKSNRIDIVIGPIETYEDGLFGYKASYESYALIKDMEWSKRLERYAAMLPELQRGLPVADAYKAEKPGTDSDLNAYDAVYYAGHCNVASKTIAINLPNDEQVQLEKGTRRLQLKNAMRAKFDKIMLPIAAELIVPEQRSHVTFDAFFADTMFHEVAHGLGIKNTLDGKGTVTQALKEYASSFEEGKADVLGLYLITKLSDKGELPKEKLMDGYVTFLAGILRSVRFGAGESHAKANMARFHFFEQQGAFTRDPKTGRYRVDFDKMRAAVDAWSAKLLTVQGDGDYAEAKRITDEMGVVDAQLGADLKKLDAAKIPVDVRFEQGLEVLGLQDAVH